MYDHADVSQNRVADLGPLHTSTGAWLFHQYSNVFNVY